MSQTNLVGNKSAFLTVLCFLLILLSTQGNIISGSGNDDKEDPRTRFSVTTHPTKLPHGIYGASIAWTGEKAYIISGASQEGPLETIYEFDPSNGDLVEKKAKVRRARSMSAAAWLPPYVYIFGGANQSNPLDEVMRYDPEKDTIEVLPSKLPTPRKGQTAVSLGGHIYIIGGQDQSGDLTEVLRFDPNNGLLQNYVELPVPFSAHTAFAYQDLIWIIGGCGSCEKGTILELDPVNRTNRTVTPHPDVSSRWSAGFWEGGAAFLIGGNEKGAKIDDIIELRPDGQGGVQVEQVGRVPRPLEQALAFHDHAIGSSYVIGGLSLDGPSDRIYKITRLEKKTNEVNVTPDKIAIVVGLMAFTLLVVALQSKYPDKKVKEEEEIEKKDVNGD